MFGLFVGMACTGSRNVTIRWRSNDVDEATRVKVNCEESRIMPTQGATGLGCDYLGLVLLSPLLLILSDGKLL